MKRITCLVCTLAFSIFSLNAQQLPDGGFESWISKDPGNGNPDFWDLNNNFITTLNMLYSLTEPLGEAPLTAFREEQDVKSGNYSLKLVSNEMWVSGDKIFLPGAVGTLSIKIVPPGVNLEKSFTFSPVALKGHLKYVPIGGDSAAIEVRLKDEDIDLGWGKQIWKDATDGWVAFNIDIDYMYQTPPTFITLVFASSAAYNFESFEALKECKGQIGSTLYLDDIEFVYETGIKEMLTPAISMSVYPNPSTENVTIEIGKETNGTILVYDYLSRKVGEYPINGTQTTVNIADYAAGSYLINVVENEKVITTGRFVKQ